MAIVTGISAPGVVKAEDKPNQLVIGYQGFPTEEIVVKDLGWLEKDLGIPVRWVQFDSGMHVAHAMAAGSVDIGLAGTGPTAAAVAQGMPVQAIWIHDVIGKSEALVVRQDAGINNVADLRGKAVAAPFASTTHYHLVVALKLNNIDARQVHILNLEPRSVLAAWNRNELDAAFIWEPTLSRILDKKNAKILLTSADLRKRGFPTGNLAIVRTNFGERYPSVVIKYIKAMDRGVKYCRSNPKAAAKSIAGQLNMPVEKAEQQLKNLILVTGKEQNAGKHLGDVYWNFGLYEVLKDTADFLLSQAVYTG